MKKRLFIVLIFFIPILSLCVAPPVQAQGCIAGELLDSTFWTAIVDGGLTDATGYTFQQLDGEAEIVDIWYWSGSAWVYQGTLPSTPSFYTSPGTDVRMYNNSNETINIEFCPPAPPTPTPTEEVIVTATPVPPTPTLTPTTDMILSDIRNLNYDLYKWLLFTGVGTLGLLLFLFVKVRQ